MKEQRGFTLVELVVSVAVVIALVSTMTVILLNSMRSTSRSYATEKVEEEGTMILADLRRNLLSADPRNITCPTGGQTQITYISRTDGRTTTLSCGASKIASVSAVPVQTIVLNSDNVAVTDCVNFIKSCDTSGAYPVVELQFGLSYGNAGDLSSFSTRTFNSKVVIRN